MKKKREKEEKEENKMKKKKKKKKEQREAVSLTSHMLSWKERLSFSSSSAISPPLTSFLTIPY